jgi:lysophospholipid acyltransferase (LPLAT)-like uncharacterized protein
MKTKNFLSKITKKQLGIIFLLFVVIIIFSSCAKYIPLEECGGEKIYGFWHGIWHGFIMTMGFIVSLFRDDVVMYAPNNSGHLYDLGYILGVMILYGSIYSSKNSKKNSKKKKQ